MRLLRGKTAEIDPQIETLFFAKSVSFGLRGAIRGRRRADGGSFHFTPPLGVAKVGRQFCEASAGIFVRN